jgi:hypothetical protein
LVFSGTFASGPGGSEQRQEDKSTLKSRGFEVEPSGVWEGWYDAMNGRLRNNSYPSSFAPVEVASPTTSGGTISSPLYTPLQRQIKTNIGMGGLYFQRWNYIQFYADNYDISIVNDYGVDWDNPETTQYPALSVCLKNANSNIKVLQGYDPYLYNPYGGEASAYDQVEDNESWFVHEADQDGNELPLTFENRLILSQGPPNFEYMRYLMNPVNSGWQDFVAYFSKYVLDQHPALDGIYFDGAPAPYPREDIWYYVIPCEAHTTESGSNGDIVIKLNQIPAKIEYQNINYVMVKVFDNANCQGADLFAVNDGGFIVGDNKEIHLNPNDPDCPAVGTQVWVKYAAKGHLPNYVKNNWVTGLNDFFKKIKNQIGNKLLIANSGEGLFERYYYEGLDGFICENFISNYSSTSTNYVYENRWLAQMNDLTDSESRGKHYMGVSGIVYGSSLDCKNLQRLRLFCYASFLMGIDKTAEHDSDASFKFIYVSPANDHEYNPQYYPEWDLPIGYAIAPYYQDTNTGLYMRQFSNGIVLVNPEQPQNSTNAFDPADPNRKVYQLNGTYYDYKGHAMTSVTLVPNSGAVLVQSLGNYVAPDCFEDCKGLPNANYEGCN